MDVFGAKLLGRALQLEIKKLMLGHAFKFVENVIFYVGENNIRSQKATEKVGGLKIGLVEKAYGDRPPSLNVRYIIKKPRPTCESC